MNKSDLVSALAARARVSKAEAGRTIEALFSAGGIIATELRRRGRVQITGFGTFETRRRGARKGRNPRTGKEIIIKASTAPVFRPGRGLKQAVNRGK